MFGVDTFAESLFTMRQFEDYVPTDDPLRPIRVMVNTALLKMDVLRGLHPRGQPAPADCQRHDQHDRRLR
jgi:hypothetical protein